MHKTISITQGNTFGVLDFIQLHGFGVLTVVLISVIMAYCIAEALSNMRF